MKELDELLLVGVFGSAYKTLAKQTNKDKIKSSLVLIAKYSPSDRVSAYAMITLLVLKLWSKNTTVDRLAVLDCDLNPDEFEMSQDNVLASIITVIEEHDYDFDAKLSEAKDSMMEILGFNISSVKNKKKKSESESSQSQSQSHSLGLTVPSLGIDAPNLGKGKQNDSK